jgi:hypothetical protein
MKNNCDHPEHISLSTQILRKASSVQNIKQLQNNKCCKINKNTMAHQNKTQYNVVSDKDKAKNNSGLAMKNQISGAGTTGLALVTNVTHCIYIVMNNPIYEGT